MFRVTIACDVCKKSGLHTYETNLPSHGKVDAPSPPGDVWLVRLREGDGGHREIYWHLCSELCLARWAADQAKGRATQPGSEAKP